MRIAVKWGGRIAADPDRLAANLTSIVPTNEVIVCHGGSRDIDALQAKLDVPMERLESPDGTTTRRTSRDVIDIMQMALRGRTQRRLYEALDRVGVKAVGLQASDCRSVVTRWKTPVRSIVDGRTIMVRDNYAGAITDVDPTLFELLLANGYVPLVCPPAISSDGIVTNVDADRLAARVAGSIHADSLCLLTDKPGLLEDPDDDSSLIPRLSTTELPHAVKQVSGGMRLKLVAAKEALGCGAKKVVIADGRRENPVTDALNGMGTVVGE